MVNGKTTKHMVMEFIYIIKLDQSMRDIGKMICSMVLEFKYILMEIDMKESLNKVKEMVREASFYLMEQFIWDHG